MRSGGSLLYLGQEMRVQRQAPEGSKKGGQEEILSHEREVGICSHCLIADGSRMIEDSVQGARVCKMREEMCAKWMRC
jgi:hypothetical protein